MLISHSKKFIFTKTAKTASTTIEHLLEPFCLNQDQHHLLHCNKELISSAGIVGARGKHARGATWYNHMPLNIIYDLMDKNQFQDYFKFTTIRNPYHKMISLFHYLEKRQEKMLKIMPKKDIPHFNINPKIESDVTRFREWLLNGGATVNQSMYFLNGQPAVDFFIRFESLSSDLRKVCEVLHLPLNLLENLPHKKPGISLHKIKSCKYYDNQSKKIIENLFNWEINYFGYELI